MEISKFIKIARLLFIAQKVNDIKPYIKLDLIARQYGKKLKRGKLQQYQKILQQKYPEKFKNYNQLVLKTIGDISLVVNKYLQKNSPQALWFYHRYIEQGKHIQDIIKIDGNQQENGSLVNVLKCLSTYQKYDKSTKKQLRDGKKSSDGRLIVKPLFDVALNSKYTFKSITDLMQKKQKKIEAPKKQFKAPQSIPQIKIPGVTNYHVYKAVGNNQKHFKQLHDIDGIGQKKQNAQSKSGEYSSYYASWCVVTGTVSWGTYLEYPWNYYYYVTTSDYKPYILMNFGTSSDAQIKDTSDHSFSNYDQEIFTIVDSLSKQDNFNPQTGSNDYKAFTKIKNVSQNKLDLNNLQKVDQLDGLIAYKQDEEGVFYIYKNNAPKYFIMKSNPMKLDQNAKLTYITFLQLLQKLQQYDAIYNLIDKGMLTQENGYSFQFGLNCILQNRSMQITKLLQNKKIQFQPFFIDEMIKGHGYGGLIDLIQNGYVTKQSSINKICSQCLKDKNSNYALYRLLKIGKLPMQYYNKTMDFILKVGSNVMTALRERLVNDDWKSKFVCHILQNDPVYYDQIIKYQLIQKPFVNDIVNIIANSKKFDLHLHTRSVIVDIINKFDNIDVKYLEKIINRYRKDTLLLIDFLNYLDNQEYLDKLYQFAKQKKMTQLLSIFVHVGKAKQQDKQQIIQNSIQNRDDKILGNMIGTGIITNKQQIKIIINRFIRAKNVSYLMQLLQSKLVSNIPTQLLLKMIKTICQNGGNQQKVNQQLSVMFMNGVIPYDYGYLFLKYYKSNWIFIRDQWSKKYFNQKFIDYLMNLEDPLSLEDAIQKDKINTKYIPYILNNVWNKEKYKDCIIRGIKGYKPRFHLPYRQTIFSWLLQNDFNWLTKNCDDLQNEFYPAIIRKLLTGDNETLLQFLKQNHYKISDKQSNAIYQKLKNQDEKYLLYLYRGLNDQNKKQLIQKVVNTNNIDYLKCLFNANYNSQFSEQQCQIIINYINTMPLSQFQQEFIVSDDKNKDINDAVVNRILKDITNPNEYTKIYLKIKWWSIDQQNRKKLKQKFFEFCNNTANIQQMYNASRQLNKSDSFVDLLLSDDVQKYTLPIANINFGQIEHYIQHLQGNNQKLNKIIQICMKEERFKQKLESLQQRLRTNNLRQENLKQVLNKYLNKKGL